MDVKDEIIKELKEAKQIVDDLATEYRALCDILYDLVDPDECSLDHHGNCQTHGWTGTKECPQKRLKAFLKKEGK